MSLTYKYYTIDETTYAYTESGRGDVLVLLHGFTGSSETWKVFVEKWQKDYRIITVDLPGHGQTTGNAMLSMKEVCHHLQLLFNYLTIGKCSLLGYSMGGRTALSFAMWYPKYIEKIILESSSPGLRTEEERQERIAKDCQLAERIHKNGINHFVDFWENIPLFATQKKLSNDVQKQIRKERLQQSAEGLAASLISVGTGEQPSWWNALNSLTKPVSLIVGEADEKFVHINEQMNQKLPQVKFHLIPNAGHTVHVEQPEAFARIVREEL